MRDFVNAFYPKDAFSEERTDLSLSGSQRIMTSLTQSDYSSDIFKWCNLERSTLFVGRVFISVLLEIDYGPGNLLSDINAYCVGKASIRVYVEKSATAVLASLFHWYYSIWLNNDAVNQPGIFSDPKSHTCRHDGADWEDCRIHIQCFGLGERKRLHLTGKNGCTATRKKRKNIPPAYTQQPTGIYTSTVPGTHSHPRRLIGKDRTQRQDTPEPVYARSVRLSIVPLNPIYRRKHHAQSVNPACTGIKWQVIQYPTSKRPRYYTWCKRLIQKMAFKIDDFTIQEDQVKNAKEIFKKYDKRGQDKISTTDLGPAFRALNLKVKPDTLKEWADQVDDDATGFIDFNGFLICYGKSLQEEQDERDLRDAFRVLDKNKKGEIDVEDLRWILKELGDDLTEEEIDDMIRDTDTDGSGFVDFDGTTFGHAADDDDDILQWLRLKVRRPLELLDQLSLPCNLKFLFVLPLRKSCVQKFIHNVYGTVKEGAFLKYWNG
ncbi:calcium-binding protein [Clonorchis sinensis]|uniref:Calcium-binding protein n=1 Tax=Clonorchis sinensis TaxID=79923 RepID=G7YP02_CLOSI|nr:calcium-binding protein [Clonorchis sinensis]